MTGEGKDKSCFLDHRIEGISICNSFFLLFQINYKEWFSELVTNEQRVNYLRDHILR